MYDAPFSGAGIAEKVRQHARNEYRGAWPYPDMGTLLRRAYLPADNGCMFYWNARRAGIADMATWNRCARLLARYQRYAHHVREVAPRWAETARYHFADNSVEIVETARDGRTRRRMIVAPGGDASY